jgi:hypothetical protein
MCFSATASFTAAGVLATIGVLTLRAAPSTNLKLIASVPLFFAMQQLLEGIVWVTMNSGQTHTPLHQISVYGFLFFAGIFWPVWVPGTLYRLEPNSSKRILLQGTLSIGILIAAFYALVLFLIGSRAEVLSHHISYPLLTGSFSDLQAQYGEIGYYLVLALYVLVIVGSCFISSIPYIWVFGLLTGLGFIVSEIFYAYALGSVWCFFTAAISICLYFIVKKLAVSPPSTDWFLYL